MTGRKLVIKVGEAHADRSPGDRAAAKAFGRVSQAVCSRSVDQAELAAKMEEFVRVSAVPNILGFLISTGLTGFAVYSLRSDPNSNRYGLPTSGGGRPDTRS